MGIEDFVPRKEDLKSCEIIEGVILAVYPHSTNPVLVQLDGHEERSVIPRYCFACSSEDLDEIRGGRKIKYYLWVTKKGKTGETVEVLPEIPTYDEGDTEVTQVLTEEQIEEMKEDAEIEKSIDEAIEQLDELREN